MKKIIVFLIFVLGACYVGNTQNSSKEFFGMWNLEIEDGAVGWLHVFENNGFLDAELLWRGGSVTPVSSAFFFDENTLMVTRSREIVRTGEEGERKMLQQHLFKITESWNDLEGVSIQPSGDGMESVKMNFKGWKLPPVPPAPNLMELGYAESIELFNGDELSSELFNENELSGWRLVDPSKTSGWKVENGVLVNDPVQEEGTHISYGNLRTNREFKDFNLELEVKVPEGSNSGVYLRGMYEIQVADTYGKEPDSHNMGALYSRIAPSVAAEKPAGEWQSMNIIFCDRHLTVSLNGTTIIDNQPVYGPTGGAISAEMFEPGPIFLQGDHGKVMYRNIVITPILK